jgi:polysaccharide chain length determinant protein (PEP-CTERM system associated)
MDGLYEQLRIAIHQVWRRRWLALAVAWGVCVLGWLVVALIPNSYESKAKVFVQTQSILPSQAGVAQQGQPDILRVQQILTSNASLSKVVRRTDLNLLVANEKDLAVQVGTIREGLKIAAQPDGTLEISAKASVSGFTNRQNARLSAAIVQGLLDVFVEENLAGDRALATQGLTIIDQALKEREQQLQEAEQRRVEFEQRFMGLLPGEGSIGQRMSAARLELAQVEQQLIQAQGSLASMRGQLGSTPATLPSFGGESSGSASSQIAILQGQLAQASARGWTDSHPDVVALRSQIDRLRPLAAQERPGSAGGMPNPSYVSLRAMVAEKEAQVQASSMRKAQLQNDLNQLGSRQADEPGVAAEHSRLNRDYEVLKNQYDKLLEDREQIRLKSDVQSEASPVQFRVIQPPSQPVAPVFPNRPIFLTVILIAALGAGAGAAFVKGQLQTTFPTQGRLEQVTGLKVLGSISEVLTDAQRSLRRRRLAWLGGGAGGLFGAYALLMVVEFWQRAAVA